MQFVFNYGDRLIQSVCAEKPFYSDYEELLAPLIQGAAEHTRGYKFIKEGVPATLRQMSTEAWRSMCSLAVQAGAISFSRKTYQYYSIPFHSTNCAYVLTVRHLECTNCGFTIDPCLQYDHSRASEALLSEMVRDHLLHDPKCCFFDDIKAECSLPEVFAPEDPALQETLQDCNDRKQEFMKELTEAGHTGWDEESPLDTSVDPSPIFNYWTGTHFRASIYNALVPKCNLEPA
jgi:hypothetical protein